MSITKALTIDKLPPADVDALKGPESVRRLLTGCWRWEPESRLSIGDCVEILQTPPVDVGGDGGPSASSPNPLRKDQSVPNDVAKVLTQVDRYRIEPSRLKFSKSNMIIGQGNYSRVLRARLKIGLFAHGDVAVKQVYVDKDRPLRNFSDELAVWTPLTHPNIVSLLGFCSVPEEHIAWLVTPYMVNGDVKNYLKRNKPPMQKRLQLAHDIAKGLEYLHTRKPPVIHRDVRATNCLVTNEGVAAITDFGLAKPYTLSLSDVSLKPAHGPVRWMAPERVDRSTRGNVMTDIWAWGCTALEVITGLPPYSQSEVDAALYYEIGTRQTPPANVDTIDAPPAIRELLSSCWEWEPDERPNITHCVTVLGVKTFQTHPMFFLKILCLKCRVQMEKHEKSVETRRVIHGL
ncbi:hypothetical protein FRB99_005950 [Tulasnella sp. 403]|nr:hypothetical protein FRB99_005950 [Tulasnella sp. 403]